MMAGTVLIFLALIHTHVQVQPYLVTVDIKRAFDAVDIDKMVALAQPILQSSQYLMVKFSEVPSFH